MLKISNNASRVTTKVHLENPHNQNEHFTEV